MNKQMKIEGKTALITGASSGIGKEFALQLAEKGAGLVVVSRSLKKLQDVVGDIREKIGMERQIEIIPMDLSNLENPAKLFNLLQEKKIHVDLLVNNAGFGKWKSFEEEKFETIMEMNKLNMVTLSALTHLFVQPMLKKGEGGILNVASTAALQPVPYMADYAATKAFVLNFSLALWQEYKDRGICITALCPGFTKTKFQETADLPDRILKKWTELTPDIVVKEAIESWVNCEPMVIPKAHQDFLQLHLSKFVPLKMKLKMTEDYFKP